MPYNLDALEGRPWAEGPGTVSEADLGKSRNFQRS